MNNLKLYVIRHGETFINVKNLVNARNCIGLNKNGKKQAEEASKQIKALDIDLIICSPLRRTVQTCKIINKNNIPVVYDRRIMERNAGSMQFKNCENIDFDLWYDIDKEIIYKNTEGFKTLVARIGQVIEEIKEKYPGKNILLVSHGGVCKAIYSYVNKITDIKQIREYQCNNCSISEYTI